MKQVSVQEYLDQILCNKRFIAIPADITSPEKVLVVIYPNLEDRNYATFIKDSSFKEAIANNTPTEAIIMEDAKLGGEWSIEDDQILALGNEKLDFLRSELKKQKFLGKKKKLQEQIIEIENRQLEVSHKRDHLMRMTAEYLSSEMYTFAILPRVVFKLNGEKFWPTEADFFKTKDYLMPLINFITSEIFTGGILDMPIIRKVARSSDWRIFWTLNKENLASLFNQPIYNFTVNQRNLVYWSRLYDMAYEATEKPDQEVIDDDELFDQWLSNKSMEKSKKDLGMDKVAHHQEQMVALDGYYIETCTCEVKKTKYKGLGESPKHDDQCPFGKYVAYTPAEKEQMANQIYGKNNKFTRNLLDQQQATVTKKGSIEEQDLRKGKTRQLMGMQSKKVT